MGHFRTTTKIRFLTTKPHCRKNKPKQLCEFYIVQLQLLRTGFLGGAWALTLKEGHSLQVGLIGRKMESLIHWFLARLALRF
jgi:hypothetical protein